MPRFVQYCDRVNFFFVLYGKKVPSTRDFGILAAIHSRFRPLAGINRAPSRLNYESEKARRGQNTLGLLPPQERLLELIQNAVQEFLIGTSRIRGAFGQMRALGNMWAVLSKAVRIINIILRSLENTWLENYGTIRASDVGIGHPREFLALMKLACKFVNPNIKSVIRHIEAFEKVINSLVSFGLTPEQMDSVFDGDPHRRNRERRRG